MGAELEALRQLDRALRAPTPPNYGQAIGPVLDQLPDIIAALERAERIEAAARDLVEELDMDGPRLSTAKLRAALGEAR